MSARSRVLGAALALVGALALAVPVSGAAGAPTPSPTPSLDPDLPVSVQITEVAPSVLRPGEDLRVRATLRNDGDEAIERPGAALRISRFRISVRADLDAWTSAGTTGLGRTRQDATAPVAAPLLPGASVPVELVVPAADVDLLEGADTWGPRGLVVEALDGTARVGIQRTFLLWLPSDDVPQTPLSVLVPVVGPPSAPSLDGPGPSAATVAGIDELTRAGGRLRELAAAVAVAPQIGVAIDPALVAAASAGTLGTQDWAADLTAELRDHDVVALPWSDPDIAAAAHADRPDLVQLALDRTAQTGIPGLSTSSGLLWAPGSGLPDETTAAVTSQVGADAIVLPPTTNDEADDDTPGAARRVQTTDGQVTAYEPDAMLTRLYTAPSGVDAGATTATTVQRALAELAVITRETEADQPHLLIAPGRGWDPDVATVAALTTAFASTPWVRLAPVATLLDADVPDTRGTLPTSAVSTDELAPASVRALADARSRAVAFAGVTSEPAVLLDGVDDEVLAPLSVAWRVAPGGRDALVSAVIADVDARTTGLSIAPVSDLVVTAADSPLPIVVRNELAVPATVLLAVNPSKACLEVGEIAPVVVEAQSETNVRVPLHARANCTVDVSAQLTATDGLAVSPAVRFTAQVAPTIESIGTIVVGILLAIGLVLGIVRTVRRGQSARRGARTEAEAGTSTSLPVLGGTAPEDDTTEQETR
ncbi:DUF6049 family protein [Cellulomonas humilata]|uniref:Uncharacterized protein n=1 Tax=Cellulomonas humilata TaxID=144055 RepID=A0ABU0EBX2_9CELL|nr:DUF6049 family protein [Cellulomonas humilata]MDQ0372593.1 hypothetical protein [Cellulomonas humilata]